MKSFSEKVVLIAGGSDKGSPVESLGQEIVNSVSHVVLMPGAGTDKLLQFFGDNNFDKLTQVKTMQEAVETALEKAEPGQPIIMSPGFASFSTFAHEFERGDAFVNIVKSL